MEIVWDKKIFLILFVLIFVIGYVNSMAIIMLNLSVFQMAITTTVCIIIGIAIIWTLGKHGCFTAKAKNEGGES